MIIIALNGWVTVVKIVLKDITFKMEYVLRLILYVRPIVLLRAVV